MTNEQRTYSVEGPESTPVREGMRVVQTASRPVETTDVYGPYTGTVTYADDHLITVLLDTHLEILDSWENELMVSPEDDPMMDNGEPITDAQPSVLRAFWYHFAPLDDAEGIIPAAPMPSSEPQPVRLDEALDAFKAAAANLGRVWEQYPPDAISNYPNGWASFDEVVLQVSAMELRARDDLLLGEQG